MVYYIGFLLVFQKDPSESFSSATRSLEKLISWELFATNLKKSEAGGIKYVGFTSEIQP